MVEEVVIVNFGESSFDNYQLSWNLSVGRRVRWLFKSKIKMLKRSEHSLYMSSKSSQPPLASRLQLR